MSSCTRNANIDDACFQVGRIPFPSSITVNLAVDIEWDSVYHICFTFCVLPCIASSCNSSTIHLIRTIKTIILMMMITVVITIIIIVIMIIMIMMMKQHTSVSISSCSAFALFLFRPFLALPSRDSCSFLSRPVTSFICTLLR